MKNKLYTTRALFISLVVLVSSTMASSALAWDFACDPGITTKVTNIPPPNINLILDASGSMKEPRKDQKVKPKWAQAKEAFKSVLEQNEKLKLANFGLTMFGDMRSIFGNDRPYRDYYTEAPLVDCAPGTEQTMMSYLNKVQFNKGTSFPGAALQVLYKAALSYSLYKKYSKEWCYDSSDTTKTPFANVIISDGNATDPHTLVEMMCDVRERLGGQGFMVGMNVPNARTYSSSVDKPFLNLAAAAGGSGSCTAGDPCQQIPGQQDTFIGDGKYIKRPKRKFDDLLRRGKAYRDGRNGATYDKFANTCSGGYSTDDPESLTQAINDIVGRMACTFPMSTGKTRGSQDIPEDPTGQYEYLQTTLRMKDGSSKVLAYAGSTVGQAAGPGWSFTFASPDRKFVRVGKDACAAIRNSTKTEGVDEVVTQFGCNCSQESGTSCELEGWQEKGLCPLGEWACLDGADTCVPVTNKEVKTKVGCNTGLLSHCADGVKVCRADGKTIDCVPITSPMPEICNGLDDDCDGIGDNMYTSWDSAGQFHADLEAHQQSNPDNYNKLFRRACTAQNACVCTGLVPPLDSMPPEMSFPATLVDYTENWEVRHASCECIAD